MPLSYTSGQSSYPRGVAGIQLAELRRKGATLCLARRAMEPSAPLKAHCPSSESARHLKSRRPFVPAAQQLISSSDNNYRSAALWADHRWKAKWLGNTRLRTLIPDIGTHPHRRSQGGQRGHASLQFLENIAILCFERRFSKQNSVIRQKSSILPPQIFWPPPNFWAGHSTSHPPGIALLRTA